MGTVIYRGSTPTIKFKPLNNVKVSDLGTPTIAIVQELVYLSPEVVVDAEDNSISAKLTEEESLQLVEGVETSAQQVWKQESGNIIRYPVHQLSVAETIMEEVEPQPAPEPTGELVNLHPFMVYSPFVENGYFTPYMDDGGTAVAEWEENSTPWSDYLEEYLFKFNASEVSAFADFTAIPVSVSSIFEGREYYLWVNVVGSDTVTVDITVGNGYSFATANGEETYSIALSNNDTLIRLVGGSAAFNQPMFRLRIRTPSAAGENKLGMALYEIQEDLPTTDYERYIPYDGGDV